MDSGDCLRIVSRKDAKIAKTQRRVKWFGRAFAIFASLRLCVFASLRLCVFASLREINLPLL